MAKRTERHVRKVKTALSTPAAKAPVDRVLELSERNSLIPSSAAATSAMSGYRPSGAAGSWGGSDTPDATGQIGTPGNLNMFGYISGEDYNPDLDGYPMFPNYNKMRLGDAQVNATLLMLKLPLKGATWTIKPASEDPQDIAIADFVQASLFDDDALARSWQHVLDNALLKFDFGCSAEEIVWDLSPESTEASRSRVEEIVELARHGRVRELATVAENDGPVYVRVKDLAPRLPRTFYRWAEDPKTGKLAYLQQFAPKNGQYGYWNIPAANLTLHVRAREGNNYYGRALALDTPIPTPDGWKRIDGLVRGDRVFTESGAICRVVARSEVWTNRPCYRVTFADGSAIVADENHEWLTLTEAERSHRQPAQIRTTKDLSVAVKTQQGLSNYAIQRCGPLSYVRQHGQLVPPYILGLWLGDGTTLSGQIACHVDDVEHVSAELTRCGYEPSIAPNGHGNGRSVVAPGLVTQLRALGVHGRKHVPAAYRYGDEAQRRALLAGLMDSDGTVNAFRQCVFTNTNRALVDAVAELVRSLGDVCVIAERNGPRRQAAGWAPAWEVRFTPYISPFRLLRKTARVITERRHRRDKHYVVAVDAVEPRDTVCIEVDSPSHLFLAGESMVPTHNSTLRTAYPHWWWKQQLYRIDMIGHDRFHVGIPRAVLDKDYNATSAPLDKIEATLKGLRSHDRAYMVQPFGVTYDVYGQHSQAGTSSSGILLSIEHHNMMIARNILQAFAAQGEQRHGSFGAAKVTADVYFDALEGEAEEIGSELKQAVIKRLCDDNFVMTGRKYPTVLCSGISAVDFTQLSESFSKLADSHLVTPDDDLEGWFRDLADAPGMPEELKGKDRSMPAPTPLAGPAASPFDPKPKKQTIAAARRPAFIEKGRSFGRRPTALERHVLDLHGIPATLDRLQAALVREMAAVRRGQLQTLAHRIAQKDARPTAPFTDIRHTQIAMPGIAAMTKAIRVAQDEALTFGRESVQAELQKQTRKAASTVELADNPTSAKNRQTVTSTLVSSAQITAKGQAESWRKVILDAALRLRRGGLQGETLEQKILDLLDEQVVTGAKRDAAEEIHEAFGLGRSHAAQEGKGEIEIATYSAILDANTCETCEELDGEEFEIDSPEYEENLPPNAQCDGRDSCRCVYIYQAKEAADIAAGVGEEE